MPNAIHQVTISVPEQFVPEIMLFSEQLARVLNEDETYIGYMIAVSVSRKTDTQPESMAVTQVAGEAISYLHMGGLLISGVRTMLCNGLMALQQRAGVTTYTRRTLGEAIDEAVRDRIKEQDPESLPAKDEPEAEPEPDQEPKRDVVYSLGKVAVVVCAIVGAMVIGYTVITAIVGGAR